MALFEFLIHLFSFDLVWIFNLLYDNLVITFGMFMIGFWYSNGTWKNAFFMFLIAVFNIWAIAAFASSIGWLYLVAGFLMMHYIIRVAVLQVANTIPYLKDKFIIVMTIQFMVVFTAYNLFFV